MRHVFAILVALPILSCGVTAPEARPAAELVLRGGAIYTVAPGQKWAEALAVRDGRIVYVGADAGAEAYIGAQTRVVDLGGRFVLPGFHDAHVHVVSGGIELGECDLNGTGNQEEILAAVRRYVAENPKAAWIVGGGWDLPVFKDANPHRSLLDAIVADRPAFLSASDGHSAWVNSKALEIAGITKDTPDPEGGRIEREPGTGEPTGTLRESAMGLVAQHIPAYSRETYREGLRRGLELAARYGITSVQEASASQASLEVYREWDAKGTLPVRAVAAMRVDPTEPEEELARIRAWREKYRGTRLRAISVKIFLDGVIESNTAALLEPYLDKPDSRGMAHCDPEALNRFVAAADKEGFQVHIHAIGDRAIRMALDAYEHAQKVNGKRDARHHIAHLQLIDPADIPRFKKLGVVANFQPFWIIADSYITELTEPKLGPERSRWLYPMGSVARTGATIACGSDWSVTTMNPLPAIQYALTRPNPGKDAPWIPEEIVDLETMIAGYTINGAYVNFQERETGSLEPGKWADLVVLDQNLFAIPPAQIGRTKVLWTLLEGREIYRDPSFRPDAR